MPPQSDNVKAGLFVLAGIVLTLVVIFTLTDFSTLFQGTRDAKIYFQLSDGLRGLKEGASVTLGDTPVGHVSSIDDDMDELPDGTPYVVGKIVTITIPKQYILYENATVELVVPPLGSGTRLNIRHQGTGVDPADPDNLINGGIAPGQLSENMMRNLGIRDKQRMQIQNIIANVEAITNTLREDLPGITASAKKAMTNIEPASADARQTMTNLKDIISEFHARRTQWLESLDHALMSLKSFMDTANQLIADKDPQLREVVDNVHAISDQLRNQTMVQITDALDKTNDSLENFKVSMQQFRGMIVGQRPVLERALANFQLTSDQLKLAAIEVRRSPWRLIYKPGDEEVANDNLYDAARSFALAAGTLDAAAQSLQAISNNGGNEVEIQRMLDHLEQLFEKYESAEKEFWDALKNRPPAK